MRYIFYTLVLFNVMFFLFNLLSPEVKVEFPLAERDPEVAIIRLLGEEQDLSSRQRQMDKAVKSPMLYDESNPDGCKAIGPFSEIAVGQAVLERLESLEIAVELRAIDRATGGFDYRVMIPPLPSLEEAFRQLRELQTQKIDSYVITQGSEALGISLGVFSTRPAAETVQQETATRGYKASIREITRLDRQYWIFSQIARDLTIDPELLDRLVDEYPGLTLDYQMCIRLVEN